MNRKVVGLVGWRGMVGSVLMQRMQQENDFADIEAVFFSTSQVGIASPDYGQANRVLRDANDLDALAEMDIILTCQGGDYTKSIHPRLREKGWNGYWIDAASALRMDDNAIIVLDPVNMSVIEAGLAKGTKDFVGGNCTVSLMLMAMDGLFKNDCIEWISSMTYQAASGAGAQNMRELINQMGHLRQSSAALLDDPGSSILELDRVISDEMRSDRMPVDEWGYPLAGSLLPWIDSELANGQSREEWKGDVETNKILARSGENRVPIDGLCVRIGAMRCHSQALTVKLNRDIPLDEVNAMLGEANDWVRVVPNTKEASLEQLSPTAVTGQMNIPVGRLRKMHMGDEYLSAFTVGDQLLWGAAEPIRRMLKVLTNL